ncbi:hypothetical protein EVAR_59887_1 [Eumeta japonica]|uniref:Uncharacterized protein n=1 Tax=Eumeta variegata TaxID=151549 RepID=A0A4C2AC79_EUMVA|nr:hypothetical protein EVAR_59887_1 [Eumeta japonica]
MVCGRGICGAKEVYEQAAVDADDELETVLHRQDREERMGWYLQGHQEHWEKPGGCFTYQRLGADVQPEQVCRPSWRMIPFSLMTVSTDGHTTRN